MENDINQRAYNYSKILRYLSRINIMETYVINGKNFIDIDDICKIEYRISNNTEVVIKNIYFNQDKGINENVKPILDFLNEI